jgi:hypothetical protein
MTNSVNNAGTFDSGAGSDGDELGPDTSATAAWVQWGPPETVENAHDQGGDVTNNGPNPAGYASGLSNNATSIPSAPSANR